MRKISAISSRWASVILVDVLRNKNNPCFQWLPRTRQASYSQDINFQWNNRNYNVHIFCYLYIYIYALLHNFASSGLYADYMLFPPLDDICNTFILRRNLVTIAPNLSNSWTRYILENKINTILVAATGLISLSDKTSCLKISWRLEVRFVYGVDRLDRLTRRWSNIRALRLYFHLITAKSLRGTFW